MKSWIAPTIVLLALAGSAEALMLALPSVPARVAVVDRVVVGKVTVLDEKLVPAELAKGDTRQLRTATVAVTETLFGPRGKEIKVGYFPPMPPGRFARRQPGVELAVGDEALFYLARHPTRKDLYLAQMYYDVAKKKGNTDFAAELDEARKATKRLANPGAGLESKDAGERYATAALILTRYRTSRPGSKTAPVPAEESKRLLTALADADWGNRNSRDRRLNPVSVFASLGLTAKDGWTAPNDYGQFADEAKKWLSANAGKYRVRRYVWPGSEDVNPEPER